MLIIIKYSKNNDNNIYLVNLRYEPGNTPDLIRDL